MINKSKHTIEYILIWAILLVYSVNLSAQAYDNSSVFTNITSDINNTFSGAGHVLLSPFHWYGEDWINFSAIIGGAVAISFVEKDIRNFALRNQNASFDRLAHWGEEYGEPLTIVLLTGSLYGTGLILNDDWLRETSVILAASLIPVGLIQTSSKIIAGRARPYLHLGNYHFESFKQKEDYYSFVSGHTLIAVTTSWVFASRTNSRLLKSVFYSAGIIGAFSRIYNDEHWMSDVILGGILGIVSANSVMNWLNSKKEKNRNSALFWQLIPRPNQISVLLKW